MEAGGSDTAVVSPIAVGVGQGLRSDSGAWARRDGGQSQEGLSGPLQHIPPLGQHTRAAAEKCLSDCLGRRSQKRETGCRGTFFLLSPLPFPLFPHSLSSPITFLSQPRAMANTSQAPSQQSSSMDPPRSSRLAHTKA